MTDFQLYLITTFELTHEHMTRRILKAMSSLTSKLLYKVAPCKRLNVTLPRLSVLDKFVSFVIFNFKLEINTTSTWTEKLSHGLLKALVTSTF